LAAGARGASGAVFGAGVLAAAAAIVESLAFAFIEHDTSPRLVICKGAFHQ
jgi:hypothetical protein